MKHIYIISLAMLSSVGHSNCIRITITSGTVDEKKKKNQTNASPSPTPSPELRRVDPGKEGTAPGEVDSGRSPPSIPRPPFSSITFFFSLANILMGWVGEGEFHSGVSDETPSDELDFGRQMQVETIIGICEKKLRNYLTL